MLSSGRRNDLNRRVIGLSGADISAGVPNIDGLPAAEWHTHQRQYRQRKFAGRKIEAKPAEILPEKGDTSKDRRPLVS